MAEPDDGPVGYPLAEMPDRCEDCGAWLTGPNAEPHKPGCIYEGQDDG